MLIFKSILTNVLSSLYTQFFESIVLAFLFMYFYEFAKKNGGIKKSVLFFFQKFKENKEFRLLFYFVFYLAMILCRTLLGRSLWVNVLNDVMGTWWIYDSNGHIYTEGVENIILFIPFTYLYFCLPKNQAKKKEIVFKSIKYSFLFSVFIEFTQLFLKLGSFQISDMVFNTLGGFIGGLLFMIFHKNKKES